MSKGLIFISCLTLAIGFWLLVSFNLYAEELKVHEVYKPKEGMPAEDLMRIWYHVKYTLFAHDYESIGDCIFIDKSGFTRKRRFLRRRIILGDGKLAYKDHVSFTYPTVVKGLAILTWSYMDPNRAQDQWLWLPSLHKIRKISAQEADDSFMGSDFTVEEITTRRFEDETYKLLGEEKFKGYTSKYDGKVYNKGMDCFIVEAKPKRKHWYYSKRTIWIDKSHGGDIYEKIYDPLGRFYKDIFRGYTIFKVDGKDYAAQSYLEAEDHRTGHKTEILFDNIKFDQGLSEYGFTAKALMRSRW